MEIETFGPVPTVNRATSAAVGGTPTSVATELMAREIEGTAKIRIPGALLFNGSILLERASLLDHAFCGFLLAPLHLETAERVDRLRAARGLPADDAAAIAAPTAFPPKSRLHQREFRKRCADALRKEAGSSASTSR